MKHAEIRDHIIAVASELFYSHGYNKTGINEVIAEAGIAKATLYNHFPTKDHLCVAYLQHKNEMLLEELKAVCEQKEGREKIIEVFHFLENWNKSNLYTGCWCINTIGEIPSQHGIIFEEIQNQKKSFFRFIQQLIQEECEIEDVESTARKIYLLYEGAVAESHIQRDNWPVKTAREIVESMV